MWGRCSAVQMTMLCCGCAQAGKPHWSAEICSWKCDQWLCVEPHVVVCPMCWRLAVAVLHTADLPGTVALQVPSTCPVSPGAHSSCFLKTGLLTSKAGWNLSSPKVILWIVFLWVKRLQVSTCCNSWYVLVDEAALWGSLLLCEPAGLWQLG